MSSDEIRKNKPDGATHYFHSKYANIYMYYRHGAETNWKFLKYNRYSKEWIELKSMPRNWNKDYLPL